ncbi:MAG TPA: glycine zipper 2TM domain-containing protein [Noviherbaspirillum sp.]|uniref:glycine zipper 2TM domain-containing protein n=1 Tax=Noviherbaspirillum sp. TaxID=1926288 RepID=UPI002D64DB54|nr:glycine zipper 2TM domain-containing protein [Noviherbaspirillum sp.]HYD94073.1 glycine zipper 2TM domain-containing protein [Noviherbaspirillum sp.]
MKQTPSLASGVLLGAAILSGCASPGYSPYPASGSYPVPVQTYPASTPAYGSYGTVDSIQMLQQGGAGNGGIGAGAVIGGVVGGMLGNQVGGGRGKKAATVAGVIGGAMVGHEIERNRAHNAYQVGVRMDNGGYRTLTQDNVSDLQVGARVRVENDRAYRY